MVKHVNYMYASLLCASSNDESGVYLQRSRNFVENNCCAVKRNQIAMYRWPVSFVNDLVSQSASHHKGPFVIYTATHKVVVLLKRVSFLLLAVADFLMRCAILTLSYEQITPKKLCVSVFFFESVQCKNWTCGWDESNNRITKKKMCKEQMVFSILQNVRIFRLISRSIKRNPIKIYKRFFSEMKFKRTFFSSEK